MPGDAETLLSKLEGTRGSAIFRSDGSVVASKLPSGVDAKELSKTALSLIDSSRQYAEKVGSSQISHAIVSGSEGVVAVAQNGGFIIVCIMGPDSDFDSAASKVKKAAEGLRGLA